MPSSALAALPGLMLAAALLSWATPGWPDGAVSAPGAPPGATSRAGESPGDEPAAEPADARAAVDAGPRAAPAMAGPIDLAGDDEGACPSCVHVCSLRHPICIDAPPGTRGPVALAALAALDAADRAWATITGVLAAPAPDGDADGSWHVQLADRVNGGSEVRPEARDPLARFDRASSFARIDRSLAPGCSLDLALARAIARASIWRAAPATDEGSALAEAETLARLATPCAAGDDDVQSFQSRPERAIVDPTSPDRARGASTFFGWADAMFASEPGRLVVGLWALAPTRTPPAASRWAGSPTGFDVLRTSLKDALGPGSTFDDALVRFSVARASMTPPARLAWSIPWPSAARRLAAPRAVAPTGASYVLVDHAGAPAGAKLRLEAAWEDYGRMRWVAVKLDASGRALAELPVTSLDRGTRTSLTIESLDATSSVLIVGVNVGSTEHPFDPDQGEWEAHGWLLTLEGE